MLLNFLKTLLRGSGREPLPADQYPVIRQQRTKQAHTRAPVDAHLDILYRDLRIGDERLTDLVAGCSAQSRVEVPPLKALRYPLASFFLARYFLHALEIDGAQAECGVFQGTSALLMCRTAQTRDAVYAGAGLHLIDSFSGLSKPDEIDAFSLPGAGGQRPSRHSLPEGTLNASVDEVRQTLKDFPRVTYHRGWIPEVFARVPESRWSFVHIDVDLHGPTRACLEYFYPRLSAGGVMICDDYGSAVFPGAYRAWNHFCDERDVHYVVLDSGQSVILKA